MLALVTGGSGSGKSAWAEGLCTRLGGPLRYVATMNPEGAEAGGRIARHRAQRAGRGFTTLECQGALEACAAEVAGATVLVDCIGNAVANLMFGPGRGGASCQRPADEVAAAVVAGVVALAGRAANVVAVTNDVAADGVAHDAATAVYVDAIACVNRELAALSGLVVEVVCGLPIALKGELL